MVYLRSVGLVAALVFTASAANAAAPLEPVGPWRVLEAKDECRLWREFGNPKDPLVLRFARGSGPESLDLLIAGSAIPRLEQKVTMRMRLMPDGPVQDFQGRVREVPGRKERQIQVFDADPSILGVIREDQMIEISVAGKFSVTVHASRGKAAIKGLEACHQRLLASWGLGQSAQESSGRAPVPLGNPADWISSRDYPRKARQRGFSGTTITLLAIDQRGLVTDCRVVLTSGDASVDMASCELLKQRGRYTPATDTAGAPRPGTSVQRVRWVFPCPTC